MTNTTLEQIMTEAPGTDLFSYEETNDPNKRSHIVRGEENDHLWHPGMNGQDVVDLARLTQAVVVALCGYEFVPKHDPEKHDVCELCVEVWEGL